MHLYVHIKHLKCWAWQLRSVAFLGIFAKCLAIPVHDDECVDIDTVLVLIFVYLY